MHTRVRLLCDQNIREGTGCTTTVASAAHRWKRKGSATKRKRLFGVVQLCDFLLVISRGSYVLMPCIYRLKKPLPVLLKNGRPSLKPALRMSANGGKRSGPAPPPPPTPFLSLLFLFGHRHHPCAMLGTYAVPLCSLELGTYAVPVCSPCTVVFRSSCGIFAGRVGALVSIL